LTIESAVAEIPEAIKRRREIGKLSDIANSRRGGVGKDEPSIKNAEIISLGKSFTKNALFRSVSAKGKVEITFAGFCVIIGATLQGAAYEKTP
jgi:hypothetical protein